MIKLLLVISEILKTMNTKLDIIDNCLNALTYEQIWSKMQPNMNSIGNLCVHLAGNEYQNFISGIGQKPFVRERSLEFTLQGGYSKDELVNLLRSVRSQSIKQLDEFSEAELHANVIIRYSVEDWNKMKDRNTKESEPYYTRNLLTLLFQVSEHYGYHTGQIVVLTKLLNPSIGSLSGYRH
jgi:uncharacterized damage-inducible protein DinB